MPSKLILFSLILALICSCGECRRGNAGWTSSESALIATEADTMRVLTVESTEDSLILRTACAPLGIGLISSPEFKMLSDKMIATVTSPGQDGVGIAGPQVGISRRIVAVQRYDKEGYPFEVYPDIIITGMRGEKVPSSEGCLSVPDMNGTVSRYQDITISYTSPATLRDTTENVSGFTAVIFQHETDHLDGILYTDYLK